MVSLTAENRGLQASISRLEKTQTVMYESLQQIHETQCAQGSGKKSRVCNSAEKIMVDDSASEKVVNIASGASAALFGSANRSASIIYFYRESMAQISVTEVLTDNVFYKLWYESSWDPRQSTQQYKKVKSIYSSLVKYFMQSARRGFVDGEFDSTLLADATLLETRNLVAAGDPGYLVWRNGITSAAERISRKGTAEIAIREIKMGVKPVGGTGASSFLKRISHVEKLEKNEIRDSKSIFVNIPTSKS